MNTSKLPAALAPAHRSSPAASAGRPWLWVVVALALFVAASVVALAICITHPQVLLP